MSWMSKATPAHSHGPGSIETAHFVVGGRAACEGKPSADRITRVWAPLRPGDHLCSVCRSAPGAKMQCVCGRCAPRSRTLVERAAVYDAAVLAFGDDAAVVRWGARCIVGAWVRMADVDEVGGGDPGMVVARSPDRGRAIEVRGEGATWAEAARAAGLGVLPREGPAPGREGPSDAPASGGLPGPSPATGGGPGAAGEPGAFARANGVTKP